MLKEKFGNAKMEDILSFEKKYNLKLPDDYINFLMQTNGGLVELDDNEVYVEELDENINIDILFGVNVEDPELGIERWLNNYRSDMLENIIIIGVSYQHGFLVLLCSGEDAGIYYWDHTHHFECSNDENNTYFMADTFTEFAKKLLE